MVVARRQLCRAGLGRNSSLVEVGRKVGRSYPSG